MSREQEVEKQAQRGESYWSLVKAQYRRRKIAVAALGIVFALFLISFFAPVLANSKPIIMKVGGSYSSPLLSSMLRPTYLADAMFNLGCFTFVGYIVFTVLGGIGRKLFGLPRRKVRTVKWCVVVALFVAFAITIVVIQKRLDTTDYEAVAKGLEAGEFVVMPPIPFHPFNNNLDERLEPPSRKHWLGTDDTGRDVLSRIIHGGRISLAVGFVTVGISIAIGIFFGALAGYYGGWVDALISRIIEIVICFPVLFIIIAVAAFLMRSIWIIMAVLGLINWPGTARLIRGEFLKLREQEFAIAARGLGASGPRTIFIHILPNAVAPALVSATFGVAGAILVESALSFLGLGVAPPTASWGEILSQSRGYIEFAWWLTTFPGIAIFVTILAYNLVGEGLRDAIDPRLKEHVRT